MTITVRFPRWYGWISHEIMEHTVHHVAPTVPCYHSFAAQQRLREVLGERCIEVPFTPLLLFRVLTTCKLYDYERHVWLDFAGRPTSDVTVSNPAVLRADPAVV